MLIFPDNAQKLYHVFTSPQALTRGRRSFKTNKIISPALLGAGDLRGEAI